MVRSVEPFCLRDNPQSFDTVLGKHLLVHTQAENLKLRSALMMALKAHIERARLTQAQAGAVFGVTQPRVSDLIRGKIDLFSLDALVNMASAAGLRVELRLSEAA